MRAAFVQPDRSNASADRRYHQEQRADGAESGEQAVVDLDPAKQRRDPDQARCDQKKYPPWRTGRCDGVCGDAIGRLCVRSRR